MCQNPRPSLVNVLRRARYWLVCEDGPSSCPSPVRDLDALGRGIGVDLIGGATRSRGSLGLGELLDSLRAVDALLEDGLDVVHLELGLEVSVGEAGRVGPTAGLGHVELVVDDLVTWVTPDSCK